MPFRAIVSIVYNVSIVWKPYLNLLEVFDVSLEMSGDPKNYFDFS